jgi:7-carboxy-7-deazaguanine synthase
MSIQEVLDKVVRYPTDLVEVTGGEPLLQKGLYPLVQRLLEMGKRVLIETGGHHDISGIDGRAILIYDVKCPGSGMVEKNNWNNLQKLRTQDQIKFVVTSRQDYDWAKDIIANHSLAEKHVILLSPVWDSLSPAELAQWILEDGLQVRIQLQLHKLLWGNRRGV